MSGLTRLIREIHRRSLWQVLGIYLAASFAVLQVISLLAETVRLPDWVTPFAVVLLLIGLPVVLATAFVQEGFGTRRDAAPGPADSDGARSEPATRPGDGLRPVHRMFTWRNAVLGGVGAFALWGFVAAGWLLFAGQSPAGSADANSDSERKSIAVLPFDNLSANQEDRHIADGMHDEILTRLANIADLKVISRTSVMEYRDRPKNLPTIAQELGVGVVLEGAVQREGDRVRIRVQLIDARTDEHMWADSYDGSLADMFGVQTDVAEQVARALEARLTDAERTRIASHPTEHLEAYEHYLKGNEFVARGITRENLSLAIDEFEQAVALDARFVLAYGALSRAWSRMHWYGYDRSGRSLDAAKGAVDRALDLAPALPEVHVALGTYYYFGQRDYARALEELAIGAQGLPNDGSLVALIGYIQKRQGRWEQSLQTLTRALELAPRDVVIRYNFGDIHSSLRRYDDALRELERAIALSPSWPTPYFAMVGALVRRDGDTRSARGIMDRMPASASPAAIAQTWFRIHWLERDYQAALDRIAPHTREIIEDQDDIYPVVLSAGQAHRMLGDDRRARAAYDSARRVLEERARRQPDDPRTRAVLGLAYAGLGRKEDAIREARAAVDLLPVSVDAEDAVTYVEYLAQTLSLVGEADAAIEQLELLLSIPSRLSIALLRTDPSWDLLHAHARFRRLVGDGSRATPGPGA